VQFNSDDYRRENVISCGGEARTTGGKLIQQPYAFIQFPSLISAFASCKRLRLILAVVYTAAVAFDALLGDFNRRGESWQTKG